MNKSVELILGMLTKLSLMEYHLVPSVTLNDNAIIRNKKLYINQINKLKKQNAYGINLMY